MKKYCLDTSGISNPLEFMPEDIYGGLWTQVQTRINSGVFAVTTEIFLELKHIEGTVGDCLRANQANLVLELNDPSWPITDYIEHTARMQEKHKQYIRENLGNKKATVGMNDLSIIALAKCLELPVVSMERRKAHQTNNLRQIPDICDAESVRHMTFNDFLRAEGISL